MESPSPQHSPERSCFILADLLRLPHLLEENEVINSQQHSFVKNKPGQTNKGSFSLWLAWGILLSRERCSKNRHHSKSCMANRQWPAPCWDSMAGLRVLFPGQCPGEPKRFFYFCRIHIPAFSRLPLSGPQSQALLSLAVVCAQNKELSSGEESSRTKGRNWGQSV